MPATPDTQAAPTRGPSTRPERVRLFVALAGVAAVAAGSFGLWQWIDGDDGPTARQRLVAERGALVMPFDLADTTHVFTPSDDGGVQTVIADDPSDQEQTALIRSHLRGEAAALRIGDFGDPATIHGHDMPGLSILRSRTESLSITYRDVPAGGEVTFLSRDPAVVQALHEWFQAQLMDHGDDAEAG